MLKAVQRHTDSKWVLLYVERWLKAPMLMPDGTLNARTKGTPQGGPVSPLLANLFLHYGFDMWMSREFPGITFERFADDAVIHCVTERQARQVRDAIGGRLADIGLELHPGKTKLVYCKDSRRRQEFDQVTFTFCGYAFRPRMAFDKNRKQIYTGFLPAVAPEKLTEMSRKIASWRIHRRTTQTLSEIARWLNPVLRGWLAYFTVFYPSKVIPLCEGCGSNTGGRSGRIGDDPGVTGVSGHMGTYCGACRVSAQAGGLRAARGCGARGLLGCGACTGKPPPRFFAASDLRRRRDGGRGRQHCTRASCGGSSRA